jgi:polyhydroxybutyrate depolymerase
VDDIAFVRQIVSDLGTIASIDTKRIYGLGFSNGGGLVYRLGCEMSDTFAAIAPVSAPLVGLCQPQQPVSLLHVHGLEDTVVPYAGGGDIIPGGFPSIEQGINTWMQLDGCTGAAQVETQQSNITHTVYASCRAGTAVELYTVGGADHEWASIQRRLPISKVIWDFFAAHSKA